MTNEPSIDLVRELFAYRSDGELIWRRRPSATSPVVVGTVAGGEWGKKKRYKSVRLLGRKTLIHRIVWAIHLDAWPEGDVDHIDGDGLNNRIENLRLATRSQNCMNRRNRSDNMTGLKGARKRKQRDGSDVWTSSISIDGAEKYLGRFSTPEEAHAAYLKAAIDNFGEYARSG